MIKVVILTAGYGEGHNTAARNLRAALEFIAPHDVEVTVLDIFETCYGRLNEYVKKAYLTAINRAPKIWGKIYQLIDKTPMVQMNLIALGRVKKELQKILERDQPHVILSTYPVYNYLLDELHAQGTPRKHAQITVITDSLTINSIWYRCFSDYFLVANEDSAQVLRDVKVAPEKIRVFGFPVTHQLASLPPAPWRAPDPLKVLFMINSGKSEAPEVAKRLAALPNVQLTVTAGRDPALQAAIRKAVEKAARPVEIHGWTQQIPQLLASHHLLISKAGGATVQESIASCTPMIITQVVPGQEEGNAQLIVENHCGVLAAGPSAIISAVESALENDGKPFLEWQKNITRFSRPEASLDIARFVLDLKH